MTHLPIISVIGRIDGEKRVDAKKAVNRSVVLLTDEKMRTLIVLTCLLGLTAAIGIGRKQSAGARGRLLCDGKPEANVLVKLYDDDRGLDLDDHMATTRTDHDGNFELSGHSHEFTSIDPKINVYHDCDDWKPCQRKFSIMIPDSYISSGSKPTRFYDAGTIELSGKMPGEERDCFHA